MTPEVKQIQSDFEKVIIHSQGLLTKNFNSEPIINQWLRNKKKFVDMIHLAKKTTLSNDYSDYIYEFPEPVSFPLDGPTRLSKVQGFIDFLLDYFYEQDVPDSVSSEFIRFLKLNKETFFENKVSVPFIFNANEITEGMKLLKSFKFFFSGKMLEDIQNKASIILQENKVTGRFCVSVHPLDYLSSSETNYDWRSCHSLDGDYRSGNLAYMTDDCTVVCYLRGEEKEKLPRFPESVPWPSKKWRMLLFLAQEEKIVWAGRQYPFESKTILDQVGKAIVPIITGIPFCAGQSWYGKIYNWTEWSQDYVKPQADIRISDSYANIGGNLINKQTLIDSTNNLFYNDLLYSTKYTPSFMTRSGISGMVRLVDKYNQRFDIGGVHLQVGKNPICPCCGRNYVEFSDELICVECDEAYGYEFNDEFVECHSCGRRIWREDAQEDDGYFYCESCSEEW